MKNAFFSVMVKPNGVFSVYYYRCVSITTHSIEAVITNTHEENLIFGADGCHGNDGDGAEQNYHGSPCRQGNQGANGTDHSAAAYRRQYVRYRRSYQREGRVLHSRSQEWGLPAENLQHRLYHVRQETHDGEGQRPRHGDCPDDSRCHHAQGNTGNGTGTEGYGEGRHLYI